MPLPPLHAGAGCVFLSQVDRQSLLAVGNGSTFCRYRCSNRGSTSRAQTIWLGTRTHLCDPHSCTHLQPYPKPHIPVGRPTDLPDPHRLLHGIGRCHEALQGLSTCCPSPPKPDLRFSTCPGPRSRSRWGGHGWDVRLPRTHPLVPDQAFLRIALLLVVWTFIPLHPSGGSYDGRRCLSFTSYRRGFVTFVTFVCHIWHRV